MFNVISGVDDSTSGAVKFRGGDDRQASRATSQRDSSRTFQHVRLLAGDERARQRCDRRAPARTSRPARRLIAGAWRLDGRGGSRAADESGAPARTGADLRGHVNDGAAIAAAWQAAQRWKSHARSASDPKLLLLDEPAAGLRYLEKRSLAELLRKLREEGLGVLLVEHDMDFVMTLADRLDGDGLRPEDRRRHARRSAARPARDRGVPGRCRREGCGMSAGAHQHGVGSRSHGLVASHTGRSPQSSARA